MTGASAFRQLGPSPAGPFTLSGSGGAKTFTWVYTAGSTPGTLTFSVSASGADANAGFPLSTGMLTIGGVTIVPPYEPCPSSLAPPDPYEVFDGPANGFDEGNGIAVDSSGSVFVAAREDREDFSRQGDGFIGYYPANGGGLYFYHEFASAGSVEDYAAAVAVAPGNRLYYAGAKGNAALIGAHLTDGTALWEFTVPAPGGGNSDARGVAADAAGNFIVTGRQYASGQDDNLWLAKYTSAGTLLWSVNDNSVANSGEAGYAVAVDASGSIYVAGYETRTDLGQGRNIAVLKYSPGGAKIWEQTYNSPANGTDEGRGITVDAFGNVYACGFESRPDLGQAENGWIRKYDAGGNVLWTTTFNSPFAPGGGPNDRANAIALSPAGDVYVTGREERVGQGGNIVLRRYDSNGLLLEVQTHNGPANGNEQGNGVAVGPDGVVYVVGTEDWTLSQNTNYTVHRWTRPGCLKAVLNLSQAVGSVGQWITAVLTVTNTGSNAVTTVIPTLAFPGGSFVIEAGPTPASVGSLAVGATASFTWTLSVSGAGAVTLTGTATGTESGSGKSVYASASAGFAAQSAASLTGVLTVPVAACVGQVFTVMATISNTGQAIATGVGVPDPLSVEGPGSVALLSSPVGLTTLIGGGSVTLTWTYSAAGLGSVRFTATATGTEGNSGQPISSGPFTSALFTVNAPSVLEAAGSGPALAPVGTLFDVMLTVSNTGAGPALGVAPQVTVSPGASPVILQGVSPSATVPIAAGGMQTFTWTYSVSGWGASTFSLSVTGSDSCGPVKASATVYTLLGTPAALAVSGPLAFPDPTCVGMPVTITLAVTNTGQVPASAVTPGVLALAGGGMAGLVAAPVALTGLIGGAAAHLVWTYSATAAGIVAFTATVTATDARSGSGLSTGAVVSGTISITPAAVLVAAASTSATAIVGQAVTVVLTVTNTGGEDAVNVTVGPAGNAGLLVRETGPIPAGPLTIPPGGAQNFIWTYSVTGAGTLPITLTVNGQTCGGAVLLVKSATAAVTGLRPGTLLMSAVRLAPPSAQIGGNFSASCTLTNGGDAGVDVVSLFRAFGAGSTGGAGAPGAIVPPPTFSLGGGASVVVGWTYTASAPCGGFTVQASATGQENGTGRLMFTSINTSNQAFITGTPTGIAFTPPASQARVQQPVQLLAHVTDSCGLGVPGATVNFTVLDGLGTLSTMSGLTDGAGNIQVTLTLGPDQETDHVRATVATTSLSAVAAVTGVNPLELKDPGAALDKNAVTLGNGEVVLARIYPLTDEPVLVRIFTASGRLVRTLRNTMPLGRHQLIATWDGRTEDEFLVARGVYLVHVTGGGLKGTVLKVVIR